MQRCFRIEKESQEQFQRFKFSSNSVSETKKTQQTFEFQNLFIILQSNQRLRESGANPELSRSCKSQSKFRLGIFEPLELKTVPGRWPSGRDKSEDLPQEFTPCKFHEPRRTCLTILIIIQR